MDTGRAHWVPRDGPPQQLRQPKLGPEVGRLSVDAVEFVPSSSKVADLSYGLESLNIGPGSYRSGGGGQQQQQQQGGGAGYPSTNHHINQHVNHHHHQSQQQQQHHHHHHQQQQQQQQQQHHHQQHHNSSNHVQVHGHHPPASDHSQHTAHHQHLPQQHHHQHHHHNNNNNNNNHQYHHQQQQHQQQHHNLHHHQSQQRHYPSMATNHGGGGGAGRGNHSVQNRITYSQGIGNQTANGGGSNSNPSGGGGGRHTGGGGGGDGGDYSGDESVPTDSEMHVLDMLNSVIKNLNKNPGMFEELQDEVSGIFYDMAQNRFVMSNAVEMIFEQSISEQNFRYMGARLCRLLDSIDVSPQSVFRTLLCLKMNYNLNELPTYMQIEQVKVRGTALFLAELYIQLQNDGTRIIAIANAIADSVFLLLSKVGPENVKCVCQCLKLCGYELEIDCPYHMKDIIDMLTKNENGLDNSTGRLLQSVFELRQNRWGRNEAVATSAPPTTIDLAQEYSDSPVFYGPDGQVLTEDERSFLLSYLSQSPNFDDMGENDGDELCDVEPEMDMEIQLAFKDFVKDSKKTTNHQPPS